MTGRLVFVRTKFQRKAYDESTNASQQMALGKILSLRSYHNYDHARVKYMAQGGWEAGIFRFRRDSGVGCSPAAVSKRHHKYQSYESVLNVCKLKTAKSENRTHLTQLTDGNSTEVTSKQAQAKQTRARSTTKTRTYCDR
ncbi:hypothetical protein KL911_002670 [Ogataea haglerorum]|uniref:uncharacterized protein n=1 Tax=Ogataea haglerorum TaxID=1937702 RepID=UPI001C8AF264|nr:uncharacterized protein KL911_002670 [Ogataea haglerorum]KAG7753277.1 hypothetical protein KL911_002670 [Ogataea haglerorum]